MARFSSSSSSSRYHGARTTYNASSGKRSPSAYDEVAVKYPNGVSTVIHHSNFQASSIARNKSNDFCKKTLRAAVEVSLFCGPDLEFSPYKVSYRKIAVLRWMLVRPRRIRGALKIE